MTKGVSKFIIQATVVALLVGFGHSYANVNSFVLTIHMPKSAPVDDCIRSYQEFLENDWKRKACVGAAFVIVKGDDIMLLTGMGEKNRKTHEPVSANSVFRVGSLSKGFASILAGSLVEQEYFDWDDKVTDYVSELAMSTEDATQKLCVENILSHSTGLPRHAYTNLIEDNMPFNKMLVSVLLRTKLFHRIVHMDNPQTIKPDNIIKLFERFLKIFRVRNRVSGRKYMTGIQTNTDSRFILDAVNHLRQLLERVTKICPLTGGRFEREGDVVGVPHFVEHSVDILRDPIHADLFARPALLALGPFAIFPVLEVGSGEVTLDRARGSFEEPSLTFFVEECG